MSARSMTGFAQVRRAMDSVELTVTLKSVNHRGLDLQFHMPSALDPFEPAARIAIKKAVERGHIHVHVAIEKGATETTVAGGVNVTLLERWLAAFHQASTFLGSNEPPNPNIVMRIPGIMAVAETSLPWTPERETVLTGAFHEALAALNEFREREGTAIADEMRGRAQNLQAIAQRAETIRASATDAFHQRLKEKLSELLRGASVDPQRLAQEAAILADRSDISEEIMRLKTHAAQLLALLDAPGEKGKKLDFLLQEMNRESNTILSKTSGLGDHGLTITDLGLAAKAEIDKMREQSLNLE